MIAYHYCAIHGREECLMGGEDGDVRSHGCRRGAPFIWTGVVVKVDMGVLLRDSVMRHLGIGR